MSELREPVLETEAGDAGEVAGVVGDEGVVAGNGGGSDEKVKVRQSIPLRLEEGAKFCICPDGRGDWHYLQFIF